MIKRNKRGDIPIVLFTILVIALCIFTLFSFYSSSGKIMSDFSDIKYMEELNFISEQVFFYEKLGKSPTEHLTFAKYDSLAGGNSLEYGREVDNSNKISSLFIKRMKSDTFFYIFKKENTEKLMFSVEYKIR